VLPSPFRAHVAERGYVTLLDGCIGLWSPSDFKEMAETWKNESRAGNISVRVFRNLMSNVREVKLDSAGRITLPRELLNEVNFGSQVLINGVFDRVEIWPAEVFKQEQNSEEASAELADAVSRLGL